MLLSTSAVSIVKSCELVTNTVSSFTTAVITPLVVPPVSRNERLTICVWPDPALWGPISTKSPPLYV